MELQTVGAAPCSIGCPHGLKQQWPPAPAGPAADGPPTGPARPVAATEAVTLSPFARAATARPAEEGERRRRRQWGGDSARELLALPATAPASRSSPPTLRRATRPERSSSGGSSGSRSSGGGGGGPPRPPPPSGSSGSWICAAKPLSLYAGKSARALDREHAQQREQQQRVQRQGQQQPPSQWGLCRASSSPHSPHLPPGAPGDHSEWPAVP